MLVYDEELGVRGYLVPCFRSVPETRHSQTFTLEKLDSLINVAWGGKSTMPSNRPSESRKHLSTVYLFFWSPDSHVRRIAARTAPPAPTPLMKKEYDTDLDFNAEIERDLLSVVEDAPPKRTSVKQEPRSPKPSTSSTPTTASGSQTLPKKPVVKQPKPKKEPVPIFMNPNSAAARVANKKSTLPKREPKSEPKTPALTPPTAVSKVAKLAGDLKNKGVKREAEPEAVAPVRVPKRSKPSSPPSKTQPQPKSHVLKPPLAAGLPPKPQVTALPPPQPQQKPQPPVKKGFSLELPTGSLPASSSKNPLLASSSSRTSLSLPTGAATLGAIQPLSSTIAEKAPAALSDSESEWDEVEADGPSPPNPAPQTHTEPQPYRLGSLTIEEDPPAGFNGTLDVIDGDEDEDEDADGEGQDIDMDDLMAEMAKELQDEGEPEGEGDANDMEDFLADAVSPEPEQEHEGYQDGYVDSYVGGDMFGDDDYSSSSDDSDD